MGLKLSQIIGVDMKRQIMITNVWVEQVNQINLYPNMYFERNRQKIVIGKNVRMKILHV